MNSYPLDENHQNNKNNLDELTCSVYCKLCGLIFKSEDASKVLTYKLLWELVKHIQKRGETIPGVKVSHSSTRPARVCNLCYMLVVGEHELIEIEQQFARTQNIPIQDAFIRVPLDSQPKHRPALLPNELTQWRLIFFINELNLLDPQIKMDYNNLYIQYKLNNQKTCFKVNVTWVNKDQWKVNIPEVLSNIAKKQHSMKNTIIKRNISQSNSKYMNNTLNTNTNTIMAKQNQNWPTNKTPFLFVNKIRVHYFFSVNNDIDSFLNNSEIKLRLTNGTDWNNFVAEGTSKTFQHFTRYQNDGQRH